MHSPSRCAATGWNWNYDSLDQVATGLNPTRGYTLGTDLSVSLQGAGGVGG